ncbi:hypothetical protein BSKO_00675 [Bryopsis sp. KO-2023]|nr:hypothetical protein BSKO_00675 [Bryopsis sp. KO-2023]
MNMQLKRYDGMRAGEALSRCSCRTLAAPASPARMGVSRSAVQVEAMKKTRKKKQVVLTQNIPQLGSKGDLLSVAMGHWRNYLGPQQLAVQATPAMLQKIREEEEAELARLAEIKAKAQAMATALKTIGKFIVKKKCGEKDRIFGSVTTQEIVDAIYQQTSRKLEKGDIQLPEIKELGIYEATVKLHPEVIGSFKIVVEKEKNA